MVDVEGKVEERIHLTTGPLSIDQAFFEVKDRDYGAVLMFQGTVRQWEKGKRIKSITYEAYHEMALKEMKKIVEEAETRWKVRISIQHRLGVVPVGEISFLVSAAGAHRPEAYAASRFVVDEVKQKVPIWKVSYLQELQHSSPCQVIEKSYRRGVSSCHKKSNPKQPSFFSCFSFLLFESFQIILLVDSAFASLQRSALPLLIEKNALASPRADFDDLTSRFLLTIDSLSLKEEKDPASFLKLLIESILNSYPDFSFSLRTVTVDPKEFWEHHKSSSPEIPCESSS